MDKRENWLAVADRGVWSGYAQLLDALVSAPDPTDAAADGLHHRYASVGLTRSGDVIHPQLRPLGLGPRLWMPIVHSRIGGDYILYLVCMCHSHVGSSASVSLCQFTLRKTY